MWAAWVRRSTASTTSGGGSAASTGTPRPETPSASPGTWHTSAGHRLKESGSTSRSRMAYSSSPPSTSTRTMLPSTGR